MQKDDLTPLEPLTRAQHAQIAAQQPRRRGGIAETVLPEDIAQARAAAKQTPVGESHALAKVFSMDNDSIFSAQAAVRAFAHIKVSKL